MKNAVQYLESLKNEGIIDDPVVEFARFLHHADDRDQGLILVGAAVMQDHLNGHICSSSEAIGQTLTSWKVPPEAFPDLQKKGQPEILGDGFAFTPLVADNGNVYLHRFWRYERELASWVRGKVTMNDSLPEQWNDIMHKAFPDPVMSDDRQRQAVERSHKKRFMILTGGPGTGKTFTVKKILESHIAVNPGLKIALAAPTGKAAQRVNESLAGTFSESIKATTIHSLLGARGMSGSFRYGSDEQLPYDVILIDEASMMDLTLWIHLIRAVPDHARLILLGDKNQLASVEAGSIFGDMCTAARSGPEDTPLAACVIELEKSYRFSEASGIFRLSRAILEGDSEKAWNLLNDPGYTEVQVATTSTETMKQVLEQYIREPFDQMAKHGFTHSGFNQRQILCALRKGPYGVEEINQQGERLIKQFSSISQRSTWYDGRPVMIMRNDHKLGIRNGETGFAFFNPEKEGYEVNFENREEAVSTVRLPEYEPSHAVTIHKSQGSEYEDVAIVLSNKENPLFSKELLYTAVTRARRSILIVSSHEQLSTCIHTKVSRQSNLVDRLTT